MDKPVAGAAGKIEACRKFCNSSRARPVPVGGVLDTVPLRTKVALCPSESSIEEKVASLEPLVNGTSKSELPLGAEPFIVRESNNPASPTDKVSPVILTFCPDATLVAVTVIVPPLEKSDPAVRVCAPVDGRLTVKVWALAAPQKHASQKTDKIPSQRNGVEVMMA